MRSKNKCDQRNLSIASLAMLRSAKGLGDRYRMFRGGFSCHSNSSVVSCWPPALALIATGAPAQDYPNQPITLMVGLAAGGITDMTARLYAEAVSKSIGQRVTVENKTGAGGGVAAAAVQNAAPDGYTLLVFSGSQHATVPAVSNAAYDPVKGFSPITYLFNSVVVLTVPADSPAKTMAELHDWGRKKPGGLTVGTPGLGLAVASARLQNPARRQGAVRRPCTIAAARR